MRVGFVPEQAPDSLSLPVQGAAHLVAGMRCAGSDLCAANRSGTILRYEFGCDILLTHIREDQADLDGAASALVAHSAQQRVHPGFVRHNLRVREPVLGAQEIQSARGLWHERFHPDVHIPSLTYLDAIRDQAAGTSGEPSQPATDVRICRCERVSICGACRGRGAGRTLILKQLMVQQRAAGLRTRGNAMTPAASHVVFIHGLWLHASSWAPWTELFQTAGYAPLAPGWPGDSDTVEETRSHADQVAGKGIDDVVDHYAQIIRGLDAPPIVIGHSFGGLIVQRLLGQDLAAAGVAIDAAPVKGVLYLPPSALRVASIALRAPANRNKAVALTPEQFHYGFANALPAQESADLYQRWTIPSPGKPLFEAAAANLSRRSPAKVNTGNKTRGPLLLIAGGHDHTVPAAITRSTRKLYHKSPAITDLREFNDRGHSLTIDHGWREIADEVLSWLSQRVK